MNALKKLVDLLAPLGFVVIVGALAWERWGKTLPGGFRPWLVGGLALVVLHLLLRWEDVAGRIGRRQMKYGSNTLVIVLAVFGILGAVNYLVVRNGKKWDLTKNQRYSLSDQTKKVVSGLKQEVKITYFQRGREMSRGQDRLKEYQDLSDKLKVEYVDPVVSPAKAQAADARGPWPILFVERGDKKEKITSDSEQDVTNALIKITREGKKTVCLATGEGERSAEDTGETGFSGAKSALTKNQYEVKDVLLLREKKVPAECTVIVVAGPQKDLLPDATDAIRTFVKDGGKALLMVEPEFKESYPNLDALAKDWNVELGKDVIVDVSGMGQMFGAGELTPIAAEYPYHEITRNFRLMTLFHMARSASAGKGTAPEGVSAQDLVQTSAQSWAETDVKIGSELVFDEKKDKKGPVSIGAAVTVKKAASPSPSPSPSPSASPAAEEPPKPPEGRAVVFGDSDWATNSLLGFQGNQDFFLNVVAWLSEDADLISIRPREPEDQRLFLTRDQQWWVGLAALAVLPGIFVVLGGWTWWRRRQ
jgi:gliding motility-associatede transport system auxiliary component